MLSPDATDDFLSVLMVAAPIYLVLRLNLWGIVLGGGFSWILGIVAGMLLYPYRGSNILDGLWIFLGLPFCLVYSGLIYGIKKLCLWGWRSTHSS